MRRVRLVSGGWASEAYRPATFVERFRGLRGQPVDARLLFETSSVHTIGMHRPIALVMIGSDRRVVRVQTLAPNCLVRERATRFILELPEGAELPIEGDEVEIFDV